MYEKLKNQIAVSRKLLSTKWKDLVYEAIRVRLFPEIWYLTESWFGTIRHKKILVVGYGLGALSEALAKSGWDVTTLDPSLTNLKILQHRFEKAQISGNFTQGDFHELPFEPESFHAVIAINILECAGNPSKVLKGIRKVITPGGYGVIAIVNQYSLWGLASVQRCIQPHETQSKLQSIPRKNFEKALKLLGFKINSIIPRARYLPLPKFGLGFNLPIPGMYVALVTRRPRKGPPSETSHVSNLSGISKQSLNIKREP